MSEGASYSNVIFFKIGNQKRRTHGIAMGSFSSQELCYTVGR